MKILNVYRSEPSDDVKKLVELTAAGNESDSFDLTADAPDYDQLVDKVLAADKTICWW